MRFGPHGVGHLSHGLRRLAPGLLLAVAFAFPVKAQNKAADNAPPVVLVRPVEVRTLAPQSEYVGRLAVFDARFDRNIGVENTGLGVGAIFAGANSILVVDGSTFDANDAVRGSAIFSVGAAEIGNSTFSANGLVLQVPPFPGG